MDRIGQVSGKLTIVGRSTPPVNKHKQSLWDVRCGWCGRVRPMRTDHFQRLKSCGCVANDLRRISHTVHGAAKNRKQTPEHKAWAEMKQRCYNRHNRRYHRYGARGIKVCAEWLHDFQAFLEHIGIRPSQPGPGRREWSLDRIDNDGDYEPGNVRWATAKKQARNKGRR